MSETLEPQVGEATGVEEGAGTPVAPLEDTPATEPAEPQAPEALEVGG